MSIIDDIASGIMDVDALLRFLATQIANDVSSARKDALSAADLTRLRFRVEQRFARVYGANQRRAGASPMYNAIVRNAAAGARTTLIELYGSLDRSMVDLDSDSWQRIRRRLLDGGTGPDDGFARMFISINDDAARWQAFLKASRFDPNRRWVDPDGYRLSDRIWHQGRRHRRAIDRMIVRGVRNGDGPVTIARSLTQFLNPDYAPLEYRRDGRVYRRRVPGYRPSAASSARTLARTEVARLGHVATSEWVDSTRIPGAGVRYSLSPSHPKFDVCDGLARGSSIGFPRGVYTVAECPSIPHANCLCGRRPYMPSRSEVLQFLTEKYG